MSGNRNTDIRQWYGDPRKPPAEEPTLLAAMRPFVELYREKFIDKNSGQDVVVVPAVWLRDLSIAFARVAKMAQERTSEEGAANG